MDFGDILDKWERRKPPNLMEALLNEGNVYDKDNAAENVKLRHSADRRRLRSRKPDDVLDIHGLTRDQAWLSLDSFFERGRSSGFEKLRIIHGKGNHSKDEAVLRKTVLDFIEQCQFAGESGYEKASGGGSGATWVLLK
ncbi:MAG: Smr/MutS family protein [Treponema sp.]|nr:Smr/MutS family protein [Treponema sp.]